MACYFFTREVVIFVSLECGNHMRIWSQRLMSEQVQIFQVRHIRETRKLVFWKVLEIQNKIKIISRNQELSASQNGNALGSNRKPTGLSVVCRKQIFIPWLFCFFKWIKFSPIGASQFRFAFDHSFSGTPSIRLCHLKTKPPASLRSGVLAHNYFFNAKMIQKAWIFRRTKCACSQE